MKILRAMTLGASLFSLTACPFDPGNATRARLSGPPVLGSPDFKESQSPLALWENSPQLSAWVNQEGISAEQREARVTAAQQLGRRARYKDGLTTIRGDLDLSRSAITSLPKNLVVEGHLDVSRSRILSLDAGLIVRGNLIIEHTPITQIVTTLYVGQDLRAKDSAVTRVEMPLHVGGSVHLDHTPLTALPENLAIAGDLNLRGTPLAELPRGLNVQGSLNITSCPIARVPDDLRVAHDFLAGNTNLSGELPPSLVQRSPDATARRRTIDLRDTEMSYDALARLRLQQEPDTTLELQSRLGVGGQASTPPDVEQFTLDDHIAAFRAQVASDPEFQAIAIAGWQLTTAHIDRVHGLLKYVRQNPNGNSALMASRVLELFARMQSEPGVRQDVLDALGSQACTTPLQALSKLEQAELTRSISDAGLAASTQEGIEAVAKRVMHKQVISRHAALAAERYSIADVRRAEQTFETQLRHRLELPATSTTPAGPTCSVITAADEDAALQAALDAVRRPGALLTFLQTFAPYQRFVRMQAVRATDYQTLPAYGAWNSDTALMCPLTQTSFADLHAPATLEATDAAEGVDTPYEFEALLQWWAQTGKAPLSERAITLESIHRVDRP